MNDSGVAAKFTGAIPKVYETYLVPSLFHSYAVDLTTRLAQRSVSRVLEIAAGTGVLTRELAAVLPASTEIVATDLNQAMIDQAAMMAIARPVEWRQADAMQLPFPDGSFDAVVCQFGVMFYPDKAKGMAETHRVLRPGGVFLFNVWDDLEHNEVAIIISEAVATVFPSDPPRFLSSTPYGYYDFDRITKDLRDGGFTQPPDIATVAARSYFNSAYEAAVAFCQGTPLRTQLEARGATGLDEATRASAEAIAKRFGSGAVDAAMQAHIITATR